MLNKRAGLVIAAFLALTGCWYLFYEKSFDIALLPVAFPAFVYFLMKGEPHFMWLMLFGYAALLTTFFRYRPIRSRTRVVLVAIGILVVLHVTSFLYLMKQFREMGATLGEQIIHNLP